MASTRASALKTQLHRITAGEPHPEEQQQQQQQEHAPVAGNPKGCEEEEEDAEAVVIALQRLMDHVLCDRQAYVKRRMSANKERLDVITDNFLRLDRERKSIWEEPTQNCNFSSLCSKSHQTTTNGSELAESEKPTTIIFGFQVGVKLPTRPLKLRKVDNVPPYTTWIYLDRNQRMTEDQSVVGRRRIYYDSDGNETLIASDSEEEDGGDDDVDDKEEPKRDFSVGEDSLIWMTILELGLKPLVLDELSDVLDMKIEEIEERYAILLKENAKKERRALKNRSVVPTVELGDEPMKPASNEIVLLNSVKEENALVVPETRFNFVPMDEEEDDEDGTKDLLAAMDSFDNLFCRRCLVFDCRLHGCSQAIVHPSDKQQPWTGTEEVMSTPCGENCYLLTDPSFVTRTAALCLEAAPTPQPQDDSPSVSPEQTTNTTPEAKAEAEAGPVKSTRLSSRERSSSSETQPSEKPVKEKKKVEKRPSAPRRSLSRRVKRQCVPVVDETVISLESDTQDEAPPPLKENESDDLEKATEAVEAKMRSISNEEEGGVAEMSVAIVPLPLALSFEEGQDEAPHEEETIPLVGVGWSQLELGLYEKGLQIFGPNSCLISRNLLRGCKTCAEVAKYTLELNAAGLNGIRRSIGDSLDIESASRERLFGARRKRNMRKLKYTFKSVLHPLIRKRLANGKDQPCRQYTPCNCLYTCGRQCPCLLNGTCCEKYCGCSKSCKNRFRGCHCAKSMCCSRQCPCFAAGRECDPDVCRNCWVGCGDGSVEGPPSRGDDYACHNMKLMLKQQQRVLLGKSDVAGWGAFLKNPVARHEYLGEYTGELISHREADKRGKIYDRENSSFLFNLNDQYVLDACRKGDKLKFANHSPQPNCYAKVIMVSGDHRVGIFAKERITAGEELFYDYRYEPDRAPSWAKEPDDPNHKREDMPSTTGRAQKAAN